MDNPKNIDEAMQAFQADIPTLVKDKKGQVGNQKTKYADLVQANEVVLKRLNDLGVIYVCKPTVREGEPKFVLHYRLTHVPSNTSETGEYPLKLAENPMQMGSAITYARRYVLLAITGVVAEDEDDDGRAAAGQRYAQRAAQQGRRQQPEGQPVQRTQRVRGGQPPLPGEDADPNGPVGADQHRYMRALWSDLGRGGDEHRDFRLQKMAGWLELTELESSANLTRSQASTVIGKLREIKDARGGAQ